jgi:hypothetical protein
MVADLVLHSAARRVVMMVEMMDGTMGYYLAARMVAMMVARMVVDLVLH